MNLKQRIRRDVKRLAGDLEATALLECLVEHLFDPGLDGHFIGKVCGASREVRDRLAATVGPLKAFITELRMIEAKRLVLETDLTVPEIGKRLGYLVPKTFRRAFKRCHKVNPIEMRRRTEAAQATAPDPVAAATSALEAALDAVTVDESLTPRARASRIRRRDALGLLDSRRATDLRDRLRRRHPELESAAGEPADPWQEPPAEPRRPIYLSPTGDHLEQFAAAAVFDRILALPEADLRHAMLHGVRTGSVKAFEILQELCFGHARWNPERAVTVAELGVQLVEMQRHLMGEAGADCKAQAWAFLGRVQMLVGKFADADRSLGFAREEIPAAATMAPWAEIVVRRVEGMLRLHQARTGEAEVALERAVELGRALDPTAPDRIQTVVERLELACRLGDAGAGLEYSDELEELVETHGAGSDRAELWRGFVAYHRGKAHAAAGRDELATDFWKQAGKHLAPGPDGAADFDTAMLGAFVTHELARRAGRLRSLDVYEILLRDTIARYQLTGTALFETAAEAELATVCALRGNVAEARRLATSAADFLEDLPSHRRAWNAAILLRVLANGGAEAPAGKLRAVLEVLCADLDSLRWEITGVQTRHAIEARRA